MLCNKGHADHQNHEVCHAGSVEGKPVHDIVLDTGCTKSVVVRSDLVPEDAVKEDAAVTIRCAHGDTALYPLATVTVEVEGL